MVKYNTITGLTAPVPGLVERGGRW